VSDAGNGEIIYLSSLKFKHSQQTVTISTVVQHVSRSD